MGGVCKEQSYTNRPGFLLWKPGRFVYFMGAFSGAQHLPTSVQLFEVLVISVFRGLSVHLSERFFQTDYRFFDDLCLIGRAICKLFGHPAVEHRLCFFDLDAEQLIRRTVQCVDDVDQRFQARHGVSGLYMADVGDHHADLIGQLFLRHAPCKAAGTDAFSDVGVVHHNTSPLRFVK